MTQLKSSPSLLVSLLIGLLVVIAAQPALAQETTRQEFDDTIHVIQRKPVLQKGRFDLVPRFGVSVNDSLYRHYKVGVNGNYHFSESVYLGGLFEWYNFGDALGGPTDAFNETANETRTNADVAVLNWVGGLELGYKPIVGKFALADSFIIFYDVGLTAGGVGIDAESLALSSGDVTFGGTVSAVSRIFLNDWMAVNLEVRDVIYSADLRGAPGSLTNIVTVAGGLSLYLPTTFEYSDQVAE
ncbi:outer membrane beta-barrel domain-containing protein [Persicimonas caeni]|jgi:outer membrane beta-barrel protein|uniref:Outer membrane beta-barrel domain-containing protein n=1 Tax=Persicimonas caeni TaxID=2292766 RepID=A0A4Y6Q197_PERCE|nr:outer membrane beta-barrel domain-containing protein [Persicimonas caeni]QDG54346.1 outer membrane beta-barrel domain-containing protein [Persicimonas caeni]QED35567.1 outer membrane beta-barrel domain-containing protein [Persicimonas caeni]